MRTFLRAHWKAIVAIVLLVVLATATVNPRAMPAALTPAADLRLHIDALVSAHADPAPYIEHMLELDGYAVRRTCERGGACQLDAAIANVAPGTRATRTFIAGAHHDGRPGAGMGAAAVLELARLLKDLRPGAGAEVRFVFFLAAPGPPPHADRDEDQDADATTNPPMPGTGGASFVAYVGTAAAARQVGAALSAFQGTANLPPRGLAAPAYLQGVTLADRAAGRTPGDATPALVITDTAFLRFPYRHADGADGAPDATPDERMVAGMARVVGALARTLTVLAAGDEG